jgi:Cys-tRNA synthase (O-phospho-L-seryl-tRNA:Cys-tRNA synthase)
VPQEFIEELASFLGVSLVIRVAAGALSSSAMMAMMRARGVFDVSSSG